MAAANRQVRRERMQPRANALSCRSPRIFAGGLGRDQRVDSFCVVQKLAAFNLGGQ